MCVCVVKKKRWEKGVGHHRMLGFVSAAEKSAESREIRMRGGGGLFCFDEGGGSYCE